MKELNNHRMSKTELKKHKKAWIQFINNNSFSHLMTLTYPPNINKKECHKMMCKFLERLSRKFFGKKQKYGKLEGFIFKEQQFNGQIHHHILLKRNQRFFEEGNRSFTYHFVTLIYSFSHILPNDDKVNFSKKHCDITEVYGDQGRDGQNFYKLTNYLLKTYTKRWNFDFVDII